MQRTRRYLNYEAEVKRMRLHVGRMGLCFFSIMLGLSSGSSRAEDDKPWPVARGPSHEPAPYRYDPTILKSVPKEFLEDAPACIVYTGVTHTAEPDGPIETTTHEITRLNSRKILEKLRQYRSITYDPSSE